MYSDGRVYPLLPNVLEVMLLSKAAALLFTAQLFFIIIIMNLSGKVTNVKNCYFATQIHASELNTRNAISVVVEKISTFSDGIIALLRHFLLSLRY